MFHSLGTLRRVVKETVIQEAWLDGRGHTRTHGALRHGVGLAEERLRVRPCRTVVIPTRGPAARPYSKWTAALPDGLDDVSAAEFTTDRS